MSYKSSKENDYEKKIIENDILILYDNNIFIIEVKSGSFTPELAINDLESHKKSLQDLIKKANEQQDKLEKCLIEKKRVSIYDSNNKRNRNKKAEIEIKPRVWASPEVAYPSTISVYYTNKINEIKGVAYNSTNNPITGRYVKTENNEEDRYIFDITDYYQTISRYSDSKDVRQLLLTIPNLTSSFNRMIIKDVPVLRVYYASYKD